MNEQPRAILIADDLTGAMDTGLQFCVRGLETRVSMSRSRLPIGADVAVLDSDSRAVSASEAYARLCAIARLASSTYARLYKKVDSTMRGNVGYELRALYEVLHPDRIVVAPAFLPSGRTTLHGRQRVDGYPLDQTFFAHDPRWPMTESNLVALLMQQSGFEVGHVGLDALAAGPAAAAEVLASLPQRIVVCDATAQEHLVTIAQAIASLGPGTIPCGSAGLADPWADAVGLHADALLAKPIQRHAPLLLVSGSRNDATVAQLAELVRERDPVVVQVDPYATYEVNSEVARLTRETWRALARGHDVVLEGTNAPLAPGAGPMVAQALALTVARLSNDGAPCGGLFLTGGDIAVAACRELGVHALRIVHRVQAGIPAGELVGGSWSGLRVVTKAGGFGDERAMLQAGEWLRGA